MSTVSPTNSATPQQPTASPCDDTFKAAAYVEQVLATELTWMTNRLTWLFISQSFCITAYVILLTSKEVRLGYDLQILFLRLGIPVLGVLCCASVGLGARAAGEVAELLADERARLTRAINSHCKTKIPEVGISEGLRDPRIKHTIFWGSLPQKLPWVLMVLWFLLVIRLDVPLNTQNQSPQPNGAVPTTSAEKKAPDGKTGG